MPPEDQTIPSNQAAEIPIGSTEESMDNFIRGEGGPIRGEDMQLDSMSTENLVSRYHQVADAKEQTDSTLFKVFDALYLGGPYAKIAFGKDAQRCQDIKNLHQDFLDYAENSSHPNARSLQEAIDGREDFKIRRAMADATTAGELDSLIAKLAWKNIDHPLIEEIINRQDEINQQKRTDPSNDKLRENIANASYKELDNMLLDGQYEHLQSEIIERQEAINKQNAANIPQEDLDAVRSRIENATTADELNDLLLELNEINEEHPLIGAVMEKLEDFE